ncbi:Fe2+-dependent dioxygenase [Parvularcula dongshanensis]|uniref:PKHD-type hydroxylase n=1 Tax=Parvularcula dongshanensis TaxID=1173995 RepID=A0A840I540_9PROT|nr:Fe2+-dependent dioxygenase [Parvularcula dongshanensis]MBB4659401.1 PKHD-type hydroxylase [Parvularcula dongshanensis]
MILTVADVLEADALAAFRRDAERLSWRDGRETAGKEARAVKRNEQADLSTPEGRRVRDALLAAVSSHPVVAAAARPRRFARLLLSRTGVGGGYGAHVDNALMGRGEARIRTDLSFTLFLSPPDAYDGGELTVYGTDGTQSFKPGAGDLVLYPSTELHEVAPVTRGVRMVCAGWIESLVPDGAQRAILFDLTNLRASMATSLPQGAGERLVLDKAIANLLRMWVRT